MPIRYSKLKVPLWGEAGAALEGMFTSEELRLMGHLNANKIDRAIRDGRKRALTVARAERDRRVRVINVVSELLFGAAVAKRVTESLKTILKGVPLVERETTR